MRLAAAATQGAITTFTSAMTTSSTFHLAQPHARLFAGFGQNPTPGAGGDDHGCRRLLCIRLPGGGLDLRLATKAVVGGRSHDGCILPDRLRCHHWHLGLAWRLTFPRRWFRSVARIIVFSDLPGACAHPDVSGMRGICGPVWLIGRPHGVRGTCRRHVDRHGSGGVCAVAYRCALVGFLNWSVDRVIRL
jgi:hypothetical protein